MTHIRYSGQHLCSDHFVRFFEKRAKLELAQQGKLPDGLTAVALSGGKDSVACLHLLHKIAAGNPRFDAERTEAGHADEFWAHALALHAAEQPGARWKPLDLGEAAPGAQEQEAFIPA